MRKIVTIAWTEFLNAVRSKAFLLSVGLLPFLALGPILIQKVAGDSADRFDRRLAVIDETGRLASPLRDAAREWNARQVAPDGTVTGARFEVVESIDGRAATPAERLSLSERVRREELYAFAEIPADVLARAGRVRYHSDHPGDFTLPRWLDETLSRIVVSERLRHAKMDEAAVTKLTQGVQLDSLGLLSKDPSGRVVEAPPVDVVRTMAAPAVLMFLLFLLIISTASPLLNSVMEEKMTRISEVMLGSVTPFQLMMGKLMGTLCVALLLGAIYLGSALGVASYYGYGNVLSVGQVAWFAVYLVLGLLIYGSLFIAIGAAATDLKDAQGMMTPAMLFLMTPMFLWMPVLRAPTSTLAVVSSLVPFATPVLMTLRLGLTPGPPVWQIVLSFVLTALTAMGLVWAAGRIFRVGVLMQGKGASFADLMRWVRVG
jgi:ABC-2 type transport system permease protein